MNKLSGPGETSGTKSIDPNPSCTKSARNDSNVYTSKFKGVAKLLNGHWGAQIFVNHQRIWLGTFMTETEAANTYDNAAIKLRAWDSHRNFPSTSITAQDPKVQSQFSMEAILSMIKDGSYPCNFANYLKLDDPSMELEFVQKLGSWKGEFLCSRLFEKELTLSDVGKLNRLVIPKKFALLYLPSLALEGNESIGQVDDMQLYFYDRAMRSWNFRYCYWKSSKSYVFTRGWHEFVQEKQLQLGDRVTFSVCEFRDDGNLVKNIALIDVTYHDNRVVVEEICVDLGEDVVFGHEEFDVEDGAQDPDYDQISDDMVEDMMEVASANAPKKGFKLFGVPII